ncbi:MAG: MFS transporter, partial [Mesorhizobium sp.]
MEQFEQTTPIRLRTIPAEIWALGFVSLLMDVSSEMIHALLPIYLVTVMGASMVTVGTIEGIAEATAAITKVFSGALSDWLGKRKLLAVPGLLAVVLLVAAVHEPARPAGPRKVRAPLSMSELRRLGSPFWLVVCVATVFTLARFSEAFLILRAQGMGLPIVLAPLVFVVMNVVYSLAAYPAGVLSDRVNRLTMLILGFLILIAADIVLAFPGNLAGVALGVGLWGLHLGFTQGLLATLVADTAPPEL